MTDNPNVTKQETVNPTDVNQGSAVQDGVTNPATLSEGTSSDHSIPYARYKADKDKAQTRITELESKLNKVLDRDKKAKQVQLEKDGKLQEALDIVKKDNDRLLEVEQQYIAIEKAERDKHLALLPEDKQEKFADYPIEMLRELSEAFRQPEKRGTVPVGNAPAQRIQDNSKIKDSIWDMKPEDKQANWQTFMNSFKK